MMDRLKNHQIERDETIWRYMSFPKFMSLLMDESIYFTRADNFEDKHEGIPDQWMMKIAKAKNTMKQYTNLNGKEKAQQDRINEYIEKKEKEILDFRKSHMVSCWHINKDYSEAMWKIYCPNNDGIAIKTTVGNLEDTLNENAYKDYILYGEVIYSNELLEEVTDEIFFTKRKYFTYENEFRMVVQDENFAKYPNGKNIEADLNKIIDEVHISPLAPLWIKPLVKKILASKKLNKSVVQKDIYQFKLDSFYKDK